MWKFCWNVDDCCQVVSFDAEWREVYVGYVRKDVFTGMKKNNLFVPVSKSLLLGECPNNIDNAAKICVKYATKDRPENAVLSAAKW